LIKYYKYNINYIYNTSIYDFVDPELKIFKNCFFLNFKKNNKLVRKMVFLVLFNFFFVNNIIFLRFFVHDFFNLGYTHVNFISQKSINLFYSLN